ncbi:MAG: hypothetical protein J7L11_08150 [Thermoprotei archaeon]|nr:hypothetical protein [Thermoprotei archaeon]
MGKVKKGITCSVTGCTNPAVKSVSSDEFSMVQTNLSVNVRGSKIYLCKEHYKVFKKASKKLRRLERWRISRFG